MLKVVSLQSNQKEFLPLHFRDDFSVVLADRDNKSTEKDSRNGLGKSTLLRIIHFCLGSKSIGDNLEKNPVFKEWEFILVIEMQQNRYRLSRGVTSPSRIKVEVIKGEHPKEDEPVSENTYLLTLQNFSKFLGTMVYGLPYEESAYAPSFRSLISYSIRKDSGYLDAFKHLSMQSAAGIANCNAFLLGLNWEGIAQIYELEDKKKSLGQMKKIAESGNLDGITASKGDLEAERVRLIEQCRSLETQLRNYKILEEYSDIESEANDLTKEIHRLVNQRVLARQIIEQYRSTLAEEKDISSESLESVYTELGLIFPSQLKHTLAEVSAFHDAAVKNRQEYLTEEIKRQERQITSINHSVTELTDKRSQLVSVLDTKGVLGEYTELRSRLSELESKLGEVNSKISSLEDIDEKLSALKIQKEEAIISIRRDLAERKAIVERAISIFNENSQRLYAEPGNLVVDITDKGLSLSIEIKRSDSNGVNRMKIFCYDLMVVQLWAEMKQSTLFLAHDSTIFEGVDSRQVAHALELAYEKANQYGFQYLCNLNSDNVPQSEMGDFYDTFQETVIRTLHDSDPSLMLLGIRF